MEQNLTMNIVLYKTVFYSILVVCVFGFLKTCAMEEIATKTASAGIEEMVGKTLEGLSAASPYVSIVLQSYSLCEEIRKHNFPTVEEKAHAQEIVEKYILITAENEFQKCMVQNRNSSQRTEAGQPEICEEIASMLILLGGKNEVDRVNAIYNQYRNNGRNHHEI